MANDSYQTSFISRHDMNCVPINWKSLKINLFQLKTVSSKKKFGAHILNVSKLHNYAPSIDAF